MDENKVMTEEELEEIIMQIIVNSGASRSLAIEAVRAAGLGNFEEADEKMKQADETILETHEYQTSLIQDEINGKHVPLSLLMVHAQGSSYERHDCHGSLQRNYRYEEGGT